MRKHWATVVCLLAGGCVASAGPIIGTNWVVNGDAESGAGSPTGGNVVVPGWTAPGSTPMFTAVQYQSSIGGFPALTDPGPASRGANFFAGGDTNAVAKGIQTLDVSALSAQIDTGQLNFVMSAYLGGFADQNDFATFVVQFLDASNVEIGGGDALLSPNAAARSSQTSLVFESVSGAIPAGTRSLQFLLSMTREQGSYDDGYADNLSFVANSVGVAAPVPEPATFAMFGIGGIALAVAGRRASRR